MQVEELKRAWLSTIQVLTRWPEIQNNITAIVTFKVIFTSKEKTD